MADSKKYNGSTWRHSLRKLGTDTDTFTTLPTNIITDGTNASIGLVGNMSQSGTPTPENPISPQETGERTVNLFDKDESADSGTVILPGTTIYTDRKIGNSNNSYTAYLPCKPNTTYRITKVNSARLRCGTTSEIPVSGMTVSDYVSGVDGSQTSSVSLTSGADAKYICIFYYNSSADTLTESEIRASIQVAESTVSVPYEPYGYKIPISSANTTTPVYLGNVQTTRYIKKRVFDGTENWEIRQEGTNNAFFMLQTGSSAINHQINASHFSQVTIGTTNTATGVDVTTQGHVRFRPINVLSMSVSDFKSFLAQQYANGTPVTVWYVLATETTGIVNEPLRKIGDYADTISYEQAGVQIPTLHGNTVIDVETELKPSEMSLTYKTWSEANAKIYLNGAWTDTPTPPVTSVVYGWRVDPSIADSSDAVTYLEDAVGMTPAAMGASTFNYGSWEDAFFMPKPCMVRSNGEVAYYLDPNDYSKKADGTPSDVANPDFDGNAMMEWGKIWYKFAGGETDGEGYFYVSNVQVDDSYHCWCNYDSKDNVTDHFYTAIYNGTGTTKLRSISGVALTSANGNGGTNVTQEVERATANNTTADVEWYTDVWSDRLLINALLVLIGKSLNTQATFGRGLDTGNQTTKEAYVTGTLNDKGLFYGVTADGNSAVKVFGMENWWGCAWHRTAGCISIDRALKIKLTYGTADGSTVIGYSQTGDGYISNGTIPSSNNYIKAMVYNQYGYAPNNVSGGSSSTYYADYFYQNTGTRYLLVGGSSGHGVSVGAFLFGLYYASSSAGWSITASLSFKPLAMKG